MPRIRHIGILTGGGDCPGIKGHVQRGGTPTPFDRILATRFGAAAVRAAADGSWGSMVALKGDRIERVPIRSAVAQPKLVDPAGERVGVARGLRTIFGDEV